MKRTYGSEVFRILNPLIRDTDTREVQMATRLLASTDLPEGYKEMPREELILLLLRKYSKSIPDLRGAIENQTRGIVLVEIDHYLKKFSELKEPITKEKVISIIIDSEFYVDLGPRPFGEIHDANRKQPISGPYVKKTVKSKGSSKPTSK
jgi:hypothetical protein